MHYKPFDELSIGEFADNESELGTFQHEIIEAKPKNKAFCIKYGVKLKYGDFNMTPQEELHSKFFLHEKILIRDMDTLTLRAHREELSLIAFEARTRISAVDWEERERKKKGRDSNGPTGFERSVNTDETTSDAINIIKQRQAKLTKEEKLIAGLVKMGMSEADAQKTVTNGKVLARIKETEAERKVEEAKKAEEKANAKLFFNPFDKKSRGE